MNQHKKKILVNNITFSLSKKNGGFSLIELLIAMFIGLFLLAGITSSYLYSKKASTQRNQLSILEDNGRLALEIMKDTIQHTGYSSTSSAPITEIIFNTTVQSKTCNVGGQSVLDTDLFPAGSTTVDGSTGDSIGVMFLGDSSISTDCTGGVLPAGCQVKLGDDTGPEIEAARIYNRFYLEDNAAGTIPILKCAGSRDKVAQEIAEGVENMQILYGLDADGDETIDRYVNASDIGTPIFDNIHSIQIAILVRSLREVKEVAEKKTYTLLDESYTNPTADRYLRAVFSTTISLRNTL